jgi:RNA 2',3'-cyclic 3'-phosphodiesterase
VRLFVAVRPPPDVIDVVSALPRPERHGVRWTRPDQWHVTLRFLGDVERREPVVAALAAGLAGAPAVRVTLGPATERLGRAVLMVPANGLDELADRVLEATRAIVPVADDDHRFHGHLTLARWPRGVARWAIGEAVTAAWTAREVELVQSQLGGGPARHEVVERFPIG